MTQTRDFPRSRTDQEASLRRRNPVNRYHKDSATVEDFDRERMGIAAKE